MKIGDVLQLRRPSFSFEFFPPRTDEGVASLLETIRSLRVLNPAFVSVTYGAGGSTRARTFEVARRIKSELEIEVLAHVTCVGATREELRDTFAGLAEAGIENVMALRGDPPKGEARFQATAGGFRYASEMIEMLAREFDFAIGGAAYPEVHPEAESADADLEVAKLKVRAGASFLTTQMFFDNEAYFRFVARAQAAGIDVPIVPGIMPITSYEQIARIAKMSPGTTLPQPFRDELEARADEPDAIEDLGVAYCALQCAELLSRGVPGIHFYTLNKSPATRAVVSALLASRTSNALLATP
jgi:methylenetetrahydrofolate reductase (NADPH)